MLKRLKITCDQATAICDKNQYGKSSVKELIKLNLHFIKCSVCALYTKQNNILTILYKGYSKSCKKVSHTMPTDYKESLKKIFEENQ